MHNDASYRTKLIPILVEDVPMLPAWCQGFTPIDCRDMSERAKMEMIQMIDNFESMLIVLLFFINYGATQFAGMLKYKIACFTRYIHT